MSLRLAGLVAFLLDCCPIRSPMSPNVTRRPFIRFVAIMSLVPASGVASAQEATQSELRVRSVSVSSGYTSVTLPPITLGGYLPQDVLSADLITTVGTDVGWHKGDSRSSYALDLSANYTQRAKFREISSLGGSTGFGASQRIGRRWNANFGANLFVANSDQLSFGYDQRAPLPSTSLDGAAALALARSVRPASNPDIAQANMFVPIQQSLAVTEAYGNRLMGTSGSAGLSYSTSNRFSAFGGFGYSNVRRIGSSNEPGVTVEFPASDSQTANVGINYSLSRGSQVAITLTHSKSTGVFYDESTIGSIGYGYTGRRWFTNTRVGVGTPPSEPPPIPGLTIEDAGYGSLPELNYSFTMGYSSRTQTVRGTVSRGLNNAHGYGAIWGKGITVDGAWSWAPRRGNWNAMASLLLSRGLGNFTYINTWHGNASVSRRVNAKLRMSGEFFYDRHGSKGFEGFHLTRRGVHLNLVWTPMGRLL